MNTLRKTVEPTIVSAKIVRSRFENEVVAVFSTGEVETLFSYFPDEISFNPNEFINMTAKEAIDLYIRRDTAYLRS